MLIPKSERISSINIGCFIQNANLKIIHKSNHKGFNAFLIEIEVVRFLRHSCFLPETERVIVIKYSRVEVIETFLKN